MCLTLGELAVGDAARVSGYAGGGQLPTTATGHGADAGHQSVKVVRRAHLWATLSSLRCAGFSLSLRRHEAQCVLIEKESSCDTGNCCNSR